MFSAPVGRDETYVPLSWYASWLASPRPSATRPLSWRSLRTLADRLSGTKNVTVCRSACTTAPITQAWAGRRCASRVPTCMNAGPCRSSTTLSGITRIFAQAGERSTSSKNDVGAIDDARSFLTLVEPPEACQAHDVTLKGQHLGVAGQVEPRGEGLRERPAGPGRS